MNENFTNKRNIILSGDIIRPYRCPVCHSRVCDMSIRAHRHIHHIGSRGDIFLKCPKCKKSFWLNMIL